MILLPLTLLLVASETLHTQKSIVLFWKISGWGTMASQGDIYTGHHTFKLVLL